MENHKAFVLKENPGKMAQKRGCGEAELVYEELEECIPSASRVEQTMEEKELAEILNSFSGKIAGKHSGEYLCADTVILIRWKTLRSALGLVRASKNDVVSYQKEAEGNTGKGGYQV